MVVVWSISASFQVNSDVVCMKRDRYGNLSPYYVDKTMVGQAVFTKSITGNEPEDITGNYKDPEGNVDLFF